ncbi:MAG: PKD domain-containing protein, partial [Flavobacteriales bacterium]|nr:PKD domain-containing protein [Flavobacteriales bacterium]
MKTAAQHAAPSFTSLYRSVLPALALYAMATGLSGCGDSFTRPTAKFSSSATTITVGQSVTFIDQSTPNDAPIDNWSWQFPGGTPTTSDALNPTVTYNTPGTYDVTLSVSNDLGLNSDLRQNYITVTALPGPVVQFTASATELYEGGSINFTDQSTGTPTSWAWTFEGGTPATSTVQNPTGITYTAPGNYDVTLVATNANGSTTLAKTDYILVLQNVPYCSPVTDIDGNTYQVVEIGSHCWMASNLRTTSYNNGVSITTGLDSATWVNTTQGAYTILDDNASN